MPVDRAPRASCARARVSSRSRGLRVDSPRRMTSPGAGRSRRRAETRRHGRHHLLLERAARLRDGDGEGDASSPFAEASRVSSWSMRRRSATFSSRDRRSDGGARLLRGRFALALPLLRRVRVQLPNRPGRRTPDSDARRGRLARRRPTPASPTRAQRLASWPRRLFPRLRIPARRWMRPANGKGANCRGCDFRGEAPEDQAAALHSTINVAVERARPARAASPSPSPALRRRDAKSASRSFTLELVHAGSASRRQPAPSLRAARRARQRSPGELLAGPRRRRRQRRARLQVGDARAQRLVLPAESASRSTPRRRRCVSSRPSRSRGSPFGWARRAASRPSHRSGALAASLSASRRGGECRWNHIAFVLTEAPGRHRGRRAAGLPAGPGRAVRASESSDESAGTAGSSCASGLPRRGRGLGERTSPSAAS